MEPNRMPRAQLPGLGASFRWHDGLLVGHREIDADHRRFFVGFTGLACRLDGGGDLEPLFTRILDDLARHLTDEERILAELGFPGASSHRISHYRLGEQARATLGIGRDGEWGTALRLLATSVLEHIAEDDGKLRPFLAEAVPAQSIGCTGHRRV